MIVIINFYLRNNEEEITRNDISYKIKNNTYIFNIDNDNYTVEKSDNIHLRKENSESIIDFIYINNKETKGTYYIKELNFYMDAKIKTNKLVNLNNLIEINYDLYLQDEYIGNFEIKFEIKE